MKHWFSVWCLVLFGAAFSAAAVGLIVVEDNSGWPRPTPPPWPHVPHAFAPLEVRSVKASARVQDQVALTTVDQEFYNPNPARLEGTFLLPVPKGAHLDKFSMEIDGRQVPAELLGADKARRLYEDIVRKLKDPALLEYAGRDLFKVRIFPIEPHSAKRIRFSFTQLLPAENGLVSYVLPLSTEKFSCRPVKNVSVKVEIETRRPLKSIYSPSHSVEVKRDGPNRATAGYEAADTQPDADFALYFAPEKDELGLNLLTHRTSGEDGYFLLLASPGVDVADRQVVSKDVAFVLDTSGSMAGKKLEQAKKALLFCLENLNSGDRFELIRFSTEVEPLFDRLVEATRPNLERARHFVHDLKPIGATDIDGALQKALALQSARNPEPRLTDFDADQRARPGARPFVIIFLTDGLPTIGTTDENRIVADVKNANGGHARIFCFGIGTDVNTHLLDKITEETRASSQYVLPDEDLEVKVSNFYAKIKEPVLANPDLKFTGEVHVRQLYPAPLPDLFKGEQLVLVGRYSGAGAVGVVIDGTVNERARRFTYDARFADSESDNEFIPRLWATRRVGYLLDQIRLHGENAELRDEATDLARKYGIVTPYTAHLIVEDESRRDVPVALQSMPELGKDLVTRREGGQLWERFKSQSSGEEAVAAAQSASTLRLAQTAEESAARANAQAQMAYRYGLSGATGGGGSGFPAGLPSAGPARVRAGSVAAPTASPVGPTPARFVAGRTFSQHDEQWVDTTIQKHANVRRVRIPFASAEYFAFASEHPQAAAWLALGQNVQFYLDGAIYEIY